MPGSFWESPAPRLLPFRLRMWLRRKNQLFLNEQDARFTNLTRVLASAPAARSENAPYQGFRPGGGPSLHPPMSKEHCRNGTYPHSQRQYNTTFPLLSANLNLKNLSFDVTRPRRPCLALRATTKTGAHGESPYGDDRQDRRVRA